MNSRRPSQNTMDHLSVEIKRSFSFIKWIHNWLRNRVSTDMLADLAVNVMHGPTILILNKYVQCLYGHPPSENGDTFTFY